MTDAGRELDQRFRCEVALATPEPPSAEREFLAPELTGADCLDLFDAQATSRHLDLAARRLGAAKRGFYSIGSSGHEGNVALAFALRDTDPVLPHYRSGALYVQRTRGVPGLNPIRDVLLGVVAAAADPISGGRHKVFGSKRAHIIPQTSTIASQLPRAVGLAFAVDRAARLGITNEWPSDAVVLCGFGDASANHSTAVGAVNTATHTARQGIGMPILFVCEDNGIGISVPTPPGWIEDAYGNRTGLQYFEADGGDLRDAVTTAIAATRWVRTRRAPAFLRLRTVRLLGHAGSDMESAYRRSTDIAADLGRDPVLATARLLIAAGVATPPGVLARYDAIAREVADTAETVSYEATLGSAIEVIAPLAPSRPEFVRADVLDTTPMASAAASEVDAASEPTTARPSAPGLNTPRAAWDTKPAAPQAGSDAASKTTTTNMGDSVPLTNADAPAAAGTKKTTHPTEAEAPPQSAITQDETAAPATDPTTPPAPTTAGTTPPTEAGVPAQPAITNKKAAAPITGPSTTSSSPIASTKPSAPLADYSTPTTSTAARTKTGASVADPDASSTSPTASAKNAAPATDSAGAPRTLAQAINHTLALMLEHSPDLLVFGEDVGRKGGVYGVTKTLRRRFGARRVFDTLLDEQSVLGTALGAGLAGFVPVPEIQYLAYVHNAADQLRGEAATLSFFSAGQYRNPMVVRIAGYAYQKGFGGHFHNDNSVAALRDIPGLVVASPARADDAAAMLRTCVSAARVDGRVCVFLEPIALYHTRDLHEDGDEGWLAATDTEHVELGRARVYGAGTDLTIVSFANGVPMSLRVAQRLSARGVRVRVLDLRWLAPLPIDDLREHAEATGRVLVADETRRSGGVSEAVCTAMIDTGFAGRIARVTSADSFVPLGPAATAVLLNETMIEEAALRLVSGAR
ncbi:thiamine pyrophosphate-dependent enzyme [Nocardia callitridis]|uniref:Transketolase-like pyrimidine-binding domain-containing protein n=1 Tax=Nocardia callitridis TaxID=648753 RepID=A0ABP9KC74_9NOCA